MRLGCAIAFVLLTATSAVGEAPRRFALILGNDFGGDGTRPLLFARDDARKIHQILVRHGGVRESDAVLVLNGDTAEALEALGKLERGIKEASGRGSPTALFLYYSGHAKDGALRLGNSQLPFASLRQRLGQVPADVRIAVLDACRSGSMTRTKGARRAPEFEVDTSSAQLAKGLVILTSSAADEDSQESDLLGGSYFSHHLASALRGAADRSGDGRVSLSEAYSYAYDRTVADTAESSAGTQHPTFAYDLAGNGDVVLTDFADRSEGVFFPAAAPEGQYLFVDHRGLVVAEVTKAAQLERRLALPAGRYRVKRRLSDRLRVGELDVADGRITTVDERRFRDVAFADDPVKGSGRAELYAKHFSFAVSGSFQAVFDRPTTAGGDFPSTGLVGFDALAHNFFGRGWSLGLDVLLGGTNGKLSYQSVHDLPYRYTQLNLGASMLAEWPDETWVPFAGARLGLTFVSRSFPADTLIPTQVYYVLTPGLVGGLRYRLSRRLSLSARARLHYLVYNVEQPPKNFGYLELAGLVSYEL